MLVRKMQLHRRLLAGIKRDASVRIAGCILYLEADALLVASKAFEVGGEVSRGRKVESRLSRRRQKTKAR
jgi:hypothetical protein